MPVVVVVAVAVVVVVVVVVVVAEAGRTPIRRMYCFPAGCRSSISSGGDGGLRVVAEAGPTPIRRRYWCFAGCRSKRAANRQSKMVESFQESCQSPKQDGIFSRELSTAKQDDGVFPRELSMGSAG